MKSVVRWAIQNTPAMNTIMVSVLAVGYVEFGPCFAARTFRGSSWRSFSITVPYPGASPEEVENGDLPEDRRSGPQH